jgi:uncharacterized protein
MSSALAADAGLAARWSGARGDLLGRATDALGLLCEWRAPGLPAIERFTGVVWDHLDPASLDGDAHRRLVVPNAVMGLSLGLDPVPDHRLGFGANVPGLGRLDRWWRPNLNRALARLGDGCALVDMLPQEHAAALDLAAPAFDGRVVSVRFLAAGGHGAAGHAAKAVKGVAARVALTEGVEALASLRWDGWRACRSGRGIDVVAPR